MAASSKIQILWEFKTVGVNTVARQIRNINKLSSKNQKDVVAGNKAMGESTKSTLIPLSRLSIAQQKLALTTRGTTIQQQAGIVAQKNLGKAIKSTSDVKTKGIKTTKKVADATDKLNKKQGRSILGAAKWAIAWTAAYSVIRGGIGLIKNIGSEFINLQVSLARLATVTRAEGGNIDDVLDTMRSAVLSYASDVGAKIPEVTETLYHLGSAGLTVEGQMAGMAHVMNLTIGTMGNVTQIARLMAGSYNLFGASIEGVVTKSEKFKHIADVLAFTYRNQQVELSEISGAMSLTASSAGLLDISFGELIGTVGFLNTSMLKGTRAGTSLMNTFLRLAQRGDALKSEFGIMFDPTAPLKFGDVVEQLAEHFQDGKLSVEDMSKLFKIFGRRSGRAIAELIRNYTRFRKTMDGTATDFDGWAEKMRQEFEDTLPQQIRRFGNIVKESLDFSGLLDRLTDRVTKFNDALQKPALQRALTWMRNIMHGMTASTALAVTLAQELEWSGSAGLHTAKELTAEEAKQLEQRKKIADEYIKAIRLSDNQLRIARLTAMGTSKEVIQTQKITDMIHEAVFNLKGKVKERAKELLLLEVTGKITEEQRDELENMVSLQKWINKLKKEGNKLTLIGVDYSKRQRTLAAEQTMILANQNPFLSRHAKLLNEINAIRKLHKAGGERDILILKAQLRVQEEINEAVFTMAETYRNEVTDAINTTIDEMGRFEDFAEDLFARIGRAAREQMVENLVTGLTESLPRALGISGLFTTIGKAMKAPDLADISRKGGLTFWQSFARASYTGAPLIGLGIAYAANKEMNLGASVIGAQIGQTAATVIATAIGGVAFATTGIGALIPIVGSILGAILGGNKKLDKIDSNTDTVAKISYENAMRTALDPTHKELQIVNRNLMDIKTVLTPYVMPESYYLSKLPKFHDGGVVPGAPGTETPIMAKGGEVVSSSETSVVIESIVVGDNASKDDVIQAIREAFSNSKVRGYIKP